MKKILKYICLALSMILFCSVFTACGTVSVSELKLDKTELELSMGDTLQLSATLLPKDATDQSINWSSSDPEIATVENGKVTAIDEGFVYIRAESGENKEIYAECEVTVKAVNYTVRFMVDDVAVSTQTVKKGGKATIPVKEPIKTGMVFDGWFTSKTGGTKITELNNVAKSADYHAQFSQSEGPIERSFIYEAEHINLYGVSGAGASGGAAEREMVTPEGNASGGRVVGYTYSEVTLTFLVWSDVDATSKFAVRLGSDAGDLQFTTKSLEFKVNESVVSYKGIAISSDDTRPFTEFALGNVDLKKGLNTITVSVLPIDDNAAVICGLLVDYIKFTTTAILTWHELESVVDPETPGYPQPPAR